MIDQETLDRFWKKVNIKGPHDCWVWQAGKLGKPPQDYGQFWLGKNELAHRVSWILFNGSIPTDKDVLHICDNPSCVNPAHLFIGTHTDNMQDAMKKGRLANGETHGSSKLTESQVLIIRSSKSKSSTLAKRFNTVARNINHIRNRETWKHI